MDNVLYTSYNVLNLYHTIPHNPIFIFQICFLVQRSAILGADRKELLSGGSIGWNNNRGKAPASIETQCSPAVQL